MYHPTGRVLTVLELLQSRPSITGMEIADRLECDIRTVRRYIGKLEDVGIPVESVRGPSGGYRLRPGFRLPPLIFTEDEASAILLGLVGTPWLRASLPSAAIESTLSKISRVLPTKTRDQVEALTKLLVMPTDTGSILDVDLLLRLSQASRGSRCIRLEYQSRDSTSRVIEPYGVVGYDGRWYVVGFCRLRQGMRVFRLDRIKNAVVLDDGFLRPPAFDLGTYIQDGLESQRWRVKLQFQASPSEVRSALGQLGTLTATPDGCDYEGPASDLNLFARQLLLSRLDFDIVGPQELKDAFHGLAEEALKRASDKATVNKFVLST
jgi:predicted DNA-binding transcriptional regulator YafY